MKLIMLQRLERVPNTIDEYTNTGGLYLNIDHISAIIPDGQHRTLVAMSNGMIYLTPFSIVGLLDDIARLNCSA